MNTNSKQSTGKTHSAAVFRIIGMLFGLFAFIWLPTAEVRASLQLISPPDCKTPNDLNLCDPTDAVTVFRWTPSENPRVHSYRVDFSDNPDFRGDNILELPIIAPQVALNLVNGNFFIDLIDYYWRVVALDESGGELEESPETFAFFYEQDQSGFTVIAGLVKSDLNQAGLVGARVAVSSARHIDTKNTNNRIAETLFNGEYIVIARTTDSSGVPILFPIEITSTKEGFQTTVVDDLKETEKVNGVITRDVAMESLSDSDVDGIRDAVENALLCLDANDADTDDDGILDGNEDADHDGVVDAFETDPCKADTDNDGLLDGTEIGLTAAQSADTDSNIFVPDIDPTTTTDPLDDDSDDDGRLDGEEDANQNGKVDAGETDPNPSSAGALPAILPLLLGD